MAINSIGYSGSPLGQSVLTLNNQLTDLQGQLASGKKSTTYAGFGSNEGFAIAARAQLANISSFSSAVTSVTTSISATNTALQALSKVGANVKSAINTASKALTSSGQTAGQGIALAQFSTAIDLLNTQAGDRYLFSGAAIDTPSVASADAILNGTSTQAGLQTIINERLQADTGASGLGRVVVASPAAGQVSVSEEAAGLPFGLKLTGVTSSFTAGGTASALTSPTPVLGDPAQTTTIDLGATNPNDGDKLTLTFGLPDGTSQEITLTASSAVPTPAGSFAIGADTTATATNLQAALTTSITALANVSLVAASAVAASNSFFSATPQRVNGSPANAATTLVNATSSDTVQWYTGEAGSGPARATSVARIDQSATVQYGARANEDAIRSQLQSIAVFAAVTFASGPNANAQIAALNQRVGDNLAVKNAGQTIADIQTDFSNAQTTMSDATARQKQSQALLQSVIDQTENISSEEVISQILSLQNSLQASYQTTAKMSQLSLVNFL